MRTPTPKLVSAEQWEAARRELLVREGAHARRDALAAKRRRMPMVALEKDYRFVGPDGPVRCSTSSTGAAS